MFVLNQVYFYSDLAICLTNYQLYYPKVADEHFVQTSQYFSKMHFHIVGFPDFLRITKYQMHFSSFKLLLGPQNQHPQMQ